MKISITDLELMNYSILKNGNSFNTGGTLFLKDDIVYKLFFKDFSKQIEYLMSLPKHPHVLNIKDQLIPEWESDFQSGYTMEYKENAHTFMESFGHKMSYQEKEKYIYQIFDAIKFLHQYIVIGDIHGDNFFIHEGNAYVYDLDYSKKLSDRKKVIKSKYYINFFERYHASIIDDIIKTYIESYALLFEIDLSYYIRCFGYKRLCEALLNAPLPKEMLTFLKDSLVMMKNNHLIKEAYVPQQYLNEGLLNAEKELKKSLENL